MRYSDLERRRRAEVEEVGREMGNVGRMIGKEAGKKVDRKLFQRKRDYVLEMNEQLS